MKLPRQIVCATCGLVACAHLAVVGAVEAAHPHGPQSRPAVVAEALPPEPDHGHQDYDRSVRVQLSRAPVLVSATPSSYEDYRKFVAALKKRDGDTLKVFRLA
jgi:hypothetical protein